VNVTVFGANGNVGKLVVDRALEEGHQVHAFVHSRDPFAPSTRLTTSAGDVADLDAVDAAMVQATAVISTLGAFRRGTGPVLAPGLRAIATAMQHRGCSRLVVLTGAGIRRPGHRSPARTRVNRLILSLMDRSAVADAEEALDVIGASDLAWTAVCAPTISPDGPAGYRLTEQMPSLLGKVPGPAVAASLVDLATRDAPTNPVLGISASTATK
jgi:nucleoside-diphosphate-sugar epimerase